MLEEWHCCSVPAFFDRLRDRAKRHRGSHHQPWPARARYSRHESDFTSRAAMSRQISRSQPPARLVPEKT